MNISKDKIDQIFQEKLEDHAVTPRPAAWEKLELKLAQNKKKIMPIWQRISIAASIALIMISGVTTFYYLQKSKEPFNNLAIETASNKGVTQNKPFTKSIKVLETTPAEKIAMLATKIVKKVETHTSNQKNKLKSGLEIRTIIFAKTENPELANTNPVEIKKINAEKEIEEVIAQNASKSIENIPEKVLVEEELTVIFTVANFDKPMGNTPIENYPEKEKKGYIARFFKQLINAKNGEKVEWDQVGFKPTKLLARAENKFKNSQREVNSSYQTLKGKTVL